MPSKLRHRRQAWLVLIASTLAFTVCFMVWMMFGVISIPVGKLLELSATEVGLMMALPILTGSLVRMPLGLWADRGDGRRLMMCMLALAIPALWSLTFATAYWHFLLAGGVIGLVGGVFAIGTPYVAHWFDRSEQGMAMGVFGAGNVGAALNQLVAPVLLVGFGWVLVPQMYAALVVLTLLLFWALSYPSPAPVPAAAHAMTWRRQARLLLEPKVLRYCQYYSVVFGGFVALALWLVQHYVGEYGLNIRNAALLAVLSTLPGGLMRGVGGVLADRYGAHSVTWWVLWVSWICLFLLSYPPTDLVIHTDGGGLSLQLGLGVRWFTVLVMVLGIAWSFGRASVFKYISEDYPDSIGAVTGVVSMVGGLAGFALPVLFGMLLDATGIRSSAFMVLYAWVWLSLIWMYWAEMRRTDVVQRKADARG
ncbi:MAG: NarK/NasA family nitrate transporter [Acidovorax sp.]|jgi:NNP family nitrate/nitrite transporter-like MFS transporter|nr:NarK/NasA family nitrate transporter [Acidovorax sp.]